MSETPLDLAHAAMQAAPEAETPRLAFYDRLASAELFLLLEAEASGDQITPRLFPVEDLNVALVFDTEARLSDLAGAAPYAAMSGRQLAGMLHGKGLGLGLNLGVATSSFLLDAAGLDWFAGMLDQSVETVDAIPEEVLPPSGLPESLITALDAKLASCEGLARCAYLSAVRYATGASSHVLAYLDPLPGAEDALTQATREALIFSGVEAGFLDVMFLHPSDEIAAKLSTVALRFDLPQPAKAQSAEAPGSDPSRPPRLR